MKTVKKPANMKAAVAASDRGEKREIPQTPCPLVQPDPYRVPIPTNIPAMISNGKPAFIVTSGSGANHE